MKGMRVIYRIVHEYINIYMAYMADIDGASVQLSVRDLWPLACPSQDSSQFSHPDVLIACLAVGVGSLSPLRLTWLGFRFGGLRPGDFRRALQQLTRLARLEEGQGGWSPQVVFRLSQSSFEPV